MAALATLTPAPVQLCLGLCPDLCLKLCPTAVRSEPIWPYANSLRT
jgi:hypothetical protein